MKRTYYIEYYIIFSIC